MFTWNTTTGGIQRHFMCFVWRTNRMSADLDSSIEFDLGFTAVALLHPATYVNKVIVSSSQGILQLWNIRSQ